MGTVVNVVVGVIFVFLVFSLVVSGVNELLVAVTGIRAKVLWQTLRGFEARSGEPVEKLTLRWVMRLPFSRWLTKADPRPMVQDAPPSAPTGFVDGILARTERFDSSVKDTRTGVKHVSPQVVSQVLLELGGSLPELVGTAEAIRRQGQEFLEQVLARVTGTQLEAPVRAAIVRAQGDIDRFRAAIEEWFDARMDALSRLYRSWSRWIMLGIAIVVALVFNVNPVRTVDSLRQDTALAQATVDQAAAFVKTVDQNLDVCSATGAGATTTTVAGATATTASPAERIAECYESVQAAVARGRQLPPPLDFDGLGKGSDSWVTYVLGCLLGAIAISFGAPFWFDVLRRAMSLRR